LSDFIIVLAVGILGLLAQAAGGKTVRRLVRVPINPDINLEPASHQEIQSSAQRASDSSVGSAKPTQTVSAAEEVKSDAEPKSDVKSAITSADADTVRESTEEPLSPSTGEASQTESLPAEIRADSETKFEVKDSKSESAEAKAEASETKSESAEAKAEASETKSESAGAKAEASETKSDSAESKPESSETKSDIAEPKPSIVEPKSEIPPVQSPSANPLPQAPTPPPAVREELVSNKKPAIEWFLRIIIFLWFIGLALYYYMVNNPTTTDFATPDQWVIQVTFVTCALTGLGLVKSFRTLLSYVFSAIDSVFNIKFLQATSKNWEAVKAAYAADRVYMPASIPHLVAFFIYVQTMYYLLAAMAPKTDFQMPGMPLPMPLPLDQLFSYNGLGLVMLAFCGCGILVTRSFKEVLKRLALVKPTPPQIMIGLGLVFMSFMYDFIWSLYTHNQHLGLDTKLAGYNGGTFTASGGFTGAIILALATAIFAGVGEETLIRGALQPVFGLVPAAILHGVLHAQFQHAPIFIVQVAGWSILMGIAKRYTNTSTTIIGHAGFNFVTTFLFAFNPPDVL
jgi:membrane protease YdiL (CAAX protease family)